MKLHGLALALALFAAALGSRAQPPEAGPIPWPPAPAADPALGYGDLFQRGYWHSCAELRDNCTESTPEAIGRAAFSLSVPVGLCTLTPYPPTPETPSPHLFIGQSWRAGEPVLPWGMGSIVFDPLDPVSLEEAIRRAGEVLQELCIQGKCCCPLLPEEKCAQKAPVVAWDPRAKTCCSFPNRCSLLSGWELEPAFPGSSTDRRCV